MHYLDPDAQRISHAHITLAGCTCPVASHFSHFGNAPRYQSWVKVVTHFEVPHWKNSIIHKTDNFAHSLIKTAKEPINPPFSNICAAHQLLSRFAFLAIDKSSTP
jgi:hypothetical protein